MPSVLAAAGVRMRVVGRTDLASAAPLGFAPSQTADEPPVVLTGDVAGLSTLPALSGVYRTHTWLAVMPTWLAPEPAAPGR